MSLGWVRVGARFLAFASVVLLAACSAHVPPQRAAGPVPIATAQTQGRSSGASGERRTEVFGRSVRGRPLTAVFRGSPRARRRVLVIGVVHGNEAAGLPIAQRLDHEPVTTGAELVVVNDLNPDGVAAGTRQNARGVDLNRNFPYRWHRTGRRGDQQWSGPTVLSEPESQALARLVRLIRPTVTVWFHQPVGVVDDSGGNPVVERRFARILGEPFRRLERYDGSAVSWQDTAFPGSNAFVVELPRPVSSATRDRAVLAVRDLER